MLLLLRAGFADSAATDSVAADAAEGCEESDSAAVGAPATVAVADGAGAGVATVSTCSSRIVKPVGTTTDTPGAATASWSRSTRSLLHPCQS